MKMSRLHQSVVSVPGDRALFLLLFCPFLLLLWLKRRARGKDLGSYRIDSQKKKKKHDNAIAAQKKKNLQPNMDECIDHHGEASFFLSVATLRRTVPAPIVLASPSFRIFRLIVGLCQLRSPHEERSAPNERK